MVLERGPLRIVHARQTLLVHGRDHQRIEDISTNAILSPAGCDKTGIADHRPLGCAIGGGVRRYNRQPYVRAEIDNRAASKLEVGKSRLAHMRHAFDVDAQQPIPTRLVHVFGICRLGDARDVHNAIQPPHFSDRGIDVSTYVFLIGDIDVPKTHLARPPCGSGRRHFGALIEDIENDDSRTFLCEIANRALTDPAAATSDDYVFPRNAYRHASLLSRSCRYVRLDCRVICDRPAWFQTLSMPMSPAKHRADRPSPVARAGTIRLLPAPADRGTCTNLQRPPCP